MQISLAVKFFTRESRAYRHLVPALGHTRAPHLVGSRAQDLALLLTTVPGTPVKELGLDAAGWRTVHQQAGALCARLHEAGALDRGDRVEAEAPPLSAMASSRLRLSHVIKGDRPGRRGRLPGRDGTRAIGLCGLSPQYENGPPTLSVDRHRTSGPGPIRTSRRRPTSGSRSPCRSDTGFLAGPRRSAGGSPARKAAPKSSAVTAG